MAQAGKDASRDPLAARLGSLCSLRFHSADASDPVSPFDLVDQAVARNHLAKDAVHAVEPEIIFEVDKELAVAGIRHGAGKSHSDAVLHVGQVINLVGDLFARAAAAQVFGAPHFAWVLLRPFDRNLFCARVAALKNEVVYLAVEQHLVVKAAVNQVQKMSDELWGLIRPQFHHKAASAFHLKLHLGTIGWGREGESQREGSQSDHVFQFELKRHLSASGGQRSARQTVSRKPPTECDHRQSCSRLNRSSHIKEVL